MIFQDFKKIMSKFGVFSLNDIRVIDPNFHRPQLSNWVQKGLVEKVRRGYYFIVEDNKLRASELSLFLVSNKIYPHSYVSLESAFSHYGFIPEGVYTVTAVSTKNTAHFEVPLGKFSYRHLKPSLFSGYTVLQNGARLATPEKALLDFIYFHPEIENEADFKELRFSAESFLKGVNLETLQEYAEHYPGATQTRISAVLKMIQSKS